MRNKTIIELEHLILIITNIYQIGIINLKTFKLVT